jgi:hypothetical protein
MRSVDDVLGAGRPVGLADLGDSDLQQRVDRKYLLTLDQLTGLADGLTASYGLLRVDGLSAFSYRSTYVDSPDLGCFHAHRQGRRLRWKARTRRYEDSGRCRFEVKLKTGRGDTDKHALLVPGGDLDVLPEPALALLDRLLADRYGLRAPTTLLPTLTVTHRRATLVSVDGAGRVTFDWDLAFAGPQGAAGRLRDGLVLAETKSRDGRSAADRLLHRAGVRPVSVSKYCVGVALTHPGVPDQPWRPLLREHFAAVPALELAA